LRNDENEAEKSRERAFKTNMLWKMEDEAAIKALRAVGCF
jgi:hypothetical protein